MKIKSSVLMLALGLSSSLSLVSSVTYADSWKPVLSCDNHNFHVGTMIVSQSMQNTNAYQMVIIGQDAIKGLLSPNPNPATPMMKVSVDQHMLVVTDVFNLVGTPSPFQGFVFGGDGSEGLIESKGNGTTKVSLFYPGFEPAQGREWTFRGCWTVKRKQ